MTGPSRLRCPDERAIDCAPWVLGALEEFEAASFADHLRRCDACATEVAGLQCAVDALAASPRHYRAPDAIRGRIMATVRAEAELLRAAGRDADLPPVAARGRRPHRRGRRWRSTGLLGGLAAAGGGLAVGVLAFGTGPAAAQTIIGYSPIPGARVVLHQYSDHGVLDVSGMREPPPGEIYEVWTELRGTTTLRPTNNLFQVTSFGRGSVPVPGDLSGVAKVEVTAEPEGGAQIPTLPVIMSVYPAR